MMKAVKEFYDVQQAKKATIEELTAQEKALTDSIAELANDRLGALSEGDEKKIGTIDKAAETAKRKLEITTFQRNQKMQEDPEQSAELAGKIRKEAEALFAARTKEDEALRKEIVEIKALFLELQTKHTRLYGDTNSIHSEINDVLKPLTGSVRNEIEKLRIEAQDFDRQISRLPSGNVDVSTRSQIDRLIIERDIRRRKYQELESGLKTIHNPVKDLQYYSAVTGGNPYVLHAPEQFKAMK